MDQLFAPWRIDWVTRDPEPEPGGDCDFCTLANQRAEKDRDNLVVARTDHTFVLLNNYPYNPGHVMVIPETHTGTYESLSDEEVLDHARLKQRTVRALEAALDTEGLNVGMNLGSAAGGSIGDHLHTHVVPRWHGDTNFMAVIGETTVIVEGLEATYDHLHEAFGEQEGAIIEGADSAIVFE